MPADWKQTVAEFVDDAHEFAGFEIPAGCNHFSAAELDAGQIDELGKAREIVEKPIHQCRLFTMQGFALQHIYPCTDCW